jgi:hypothetical protein
MIQVLISHSKAPGLLLLVGGGRKTNPIRGIAQHLLPQTTLKTLLQLDEYLDSLA